MTGESALDLFRRETRISYGPVPRRLNEFDVPEDSEILKDERYILRTVHGIAYHYRKGDGITIECPPGHDPAIEKLYLHGSVYAAAASILGLLPVHASAVVHEGRVFAFSGASGAGKSTLIAGLSARGFAMYCDDTLILDISDMANVMCLPGHKRLKLWPDALVLTGAQPQEKVAGFLDKRFALPASGSEDRMLPLAELSFLGESARAGFHPIPGGERVALLQADPYAIDLFVSASGHNRRERFARLTGLASAIRMNRFERPRDPAQFDQGVRVAENHIRSAVCAAAGDSSR